MGEAVEGREESNPLVTGELVSFLEHNPAYYPIMRSGLCILLLKSLAGKAKNLAMLKAKFPQMGQDDIADLVQTLVSVGAVSFFDAGSSRFFYANDNGKFFLSVYSHAKEAFFGAEQ